MSECKPTLQMYSSLFVTIDLLTKERDEAIKQRDEALQERDQARRMYCTCMESPTRTSGTPAKETAALWEWDCFKEEMACDTLSQEVSQEGSKLPATISSNGIRITEYIPPENSVREIPPYGAYTIGESTLSALSRQEIDQLRKERDAARREVCRLMSMFNAENSVEIAASRSWDCFKETP